MNCQNCSSQRILEVSAKCSDLCDVCIPSINQSKDGYVPYNMNIGGGDYVEFSVCLDCGVIQGTWPLPVTQMERKAQRESAKQTEKTTWQCDPQYAEFVNCVLAAANPTTGIGPLMPVIFVENISPEAVIAAITALMIVPDLENIAETLIDMLRDWEHYQELRASIRSATYVSRFEDPDDPDYECDEDEEDI